MGRFDYIFGQFRETAQCRDAQHGNGVCCALAPQLVYFLIQCIDADYQATGKHHACTSSCTKNCWKL